MVTLTLSLVSHTNAGKTTLARTLLGADVGEVRDAPHVTEFAEGHELIDCAGETAASERDRLRLWDTPGFGDSARLVRRMRQSAQPLGWFLGHVWDRWRDRPFWASQQALRHVQEHSDLVLYLVNAAESPELAGYVPAEMDLLAWLGKPVLVLLNQLGEPRAAADEAAEVQAWRRHLGAWPLVQAVLPMDAFARCWVHEATLWQAVQSALADSASAQAMGRLAVAWAARRQVTFDAAMDELAHSLARTALMRAPVQQSAGIGQRLRQLGQNLNSTVMGQFGGPANATHPAALAQLNLLASQQVEVQTSTARLIKLHGLAGAVQAEVLQRVQSQFAARQHVPEGKAALLGGAVSGALVGLKADVASGGLTLGGGLLVGAVLGALGAAGVARGVNVVRGTDQSWVAFSDEALAPGVQAALLRYLAVAHFGRGRGDWAASEAPAHWQTAVAEVLAAQAEAWAAVWRDRDPHALAGGADDAQADAAAQRLASSMRPLLASAVDLVLGRLYPRENGP